MSLPETAPVTPPPRSAGIFVWTALALVFVLVTLTHAFETAMHFDGSAIDGPFQLYNALRRIQAGFRPGVDFQFFHGFGIPYAHYWAYRLFGEGLRGSELARELISAIAYPLVYLFAFRALTGRWATAVCMTAAAMAIAYALRLYAIVFAINGMLGLRSAIPTLLPPLLYTIRDRPRRHLVAGLLVGLALWMSTEQGLAFVLATIVSYVLFTIRDHDWKRGGTALAQVVGVAVVVLVALELMIGGVAGMRGALRYNFALIPGDQYWYFGAPPNTFVPSWTIGFAMITQGWVMALAVFGSLAAAIYYVVSAWRTADPLDRARRDTFASMSIYAFVSCSSLLGVYTGAYTQPALRVLIVIAVVEWARYGARMDAQRSRGSWLGVPRSLAMVTALLAVFGVVSVQLVALELLYSVPHIIQDHIIGHMGFGVSAIWPETLAQDEAVVDAHRGPGGEPPVVWSTYAGWLEARAGIFHPGTDYIIHALGKQNREAYVAQFVATKPALVQTVLPTYTQYEAWIENNHWDFYDALLRRYRVISITPWSIFWERRLDPLPPTPWAAELRPAPGSRSMTFHTPPGDSGSVLLEAEITYATRNPLEKLPVVGATPRYLIGFFGAFGQPAISLAPYDTVKRFPILARPNTDLTLSFGTFGLLPGASWEPHALRLRVAPIDANNAPWLTSLRQRVTRPPPPKE